MTWGRVPCCNNASPAFPYHLDFTNIPTGLQES